jgi:hypothetical protein
MYTLRDFLGFFLGAAITAALIVLLLPPSPCGVVVPAEQELALDNGGQSANPSTKKLDTDTVLTVFIPAPFPLFASFILVPLLACSEFLLRHTFCRLRLQLGRTTSRSCFGAQQWRTTPS